jgi:hypothetical protein
MEIAMKMLAFFLSLSAVGFYGVTLLILTDQFVKAFMDAEDIDAQEVFETIPSRLLLFSLSLSGCILWWAVGASLSAF